MEEKRKKSDNALYYKRTATELRCASHDIDDAIITMQNLDIFWKDNDTDLLFLQQSIRQIIDKFNSYALKKNYDYICELEQAIEDKGDEDDAR